jgi:hypothetical protein
MPTYTARRGWQRVLQARIPTLFGLGILILGVVAGIVLLGQGTSGFLPRASEDAVPKNIRITNITDTGFTVSFLTDAAAPGYIEYGTAPGRTNVQVRDDRDQLANSSGSFTTHHVTVRGLSPTTQYYFRLGTGGRTKFDNNGEPFAVRTARPIAAGSEARTAYGTVNSEVGNPADGAIVYLTIQGASPLSAQVKSDGTWALPLSGVRSLDLSGAVTLTDATPVRIDVQGNKTSDTLRVDSTVGALMPLQTLKFGTTPVVNAGTGDTSEGEGDEPADSDTPDVLPDDTEATGEGSFSNLVGEGEGDVAITPDEVDIRLEDEEVLTTTQPEFQGTAPAGGYIQIEVHSETPYYGAVQASANGEWNWTPPADLEPGPHTITVTYIDDNGVQQKVERTFIVQAGGENSVPSFISTPSATQATPKPTATPLPTPRAIAQASATPVPTSTPIPTALPTSAPVASAAAQPVSGSTGMTLSLLAIAVTCFVVGGGTTAWAWRTSDSRRGDYHG